MKRIIAIILLLPVVVLFALGCSSQESTTNQNNTVSVSFMGWIPYASDVDIMVDKFNDRYPEINVNVTTLDWAAYWEKLTLDLSTGDGPDAFAMNLDYLSKFTDYTEPIDSLAESVIGSDWKDKFKPDMLNSVYTDEKADIMPAGFGGQWYIFYNKTLINELDKEVPNDYIGWAEVCSIADENGTPMVFGGKEAMNTAYLYFWLVNNVEPGIVAKAARGEVSFTDKAFITGFEGFNKFVEDKVIPRESFGIDPTPGADSLFKDRKSIGYISGFWMTGAYLGGSQLDGTAIEDDEIGVAVLPNPFGTKTYVVGSVDHGWSINSSSDQKEAAMKLIAEWTLGSAGEYWQNVLFSIPCGVGVELDASVMKTEEARNTVGIIAESLSTVLAGPRSTGDVTIDNKAGEVVLGTMLGSMTPETALLELQKAYESD